MHLWNELEWKLLKHFQNRKKVWFSTSTVKFPEKDSQSETVGYYALYFFCYLESLLNFGSTSERVLLIIPYPTFLTYFEEVIVFYFWRV